MVLKASKDCKIISKKIIHIFVNTVRVEKNRSKYLALRPIFMLLQITISPAKLHMVVMLPPPNTHTN